MRYNIAVVGVGGQGLLTLGSLIGSACMMKGHDVAIAEVHGMSQRGGSVIVHVRIGNNPSPIIPVGGADHIIALELIEAARYIHYARKGGVVSVNDFIWPPPLSTYPSRESIMNELRGKQVKLFIHDANDLSVKIAGSPISANVAMLGYAIGVDERLRGLISIDDVERALSTIFKGKALDLNREILRRAYQDGLKDANQR